MSCSISEEKMKHVLERVLENDENAILVVRNAIWTRNHQQLIFDFFSKRSDKISLYFTGLCHCNECGTEWDESKALECFKKSASEEYAPAVSMIGCYYMDGVCVGKDSREAEKFFRKAIGLGFEKAYCLLARIFMDGDKYFPKDEKTAIEYLFKSIEAKSDFGYINLGNCYREGRGIQKNESKAIECFNKAIELGNISGYFHLALMHGDKKEHEKEVEIYKNPCLLFYGGAHTNLGYCYADGLGVEQDDHKAFLHYEKASSLRSCQGCINLGFCYFDGKGGETDYKKAFGYFQKAVLYDEDNPDAWSSMSRCYETGKGTEKDLDKAIECTEKECCLSRSTSGLVELGVKFMYGHNIDIDKERGFRCFHRAVEIADNNHEINASPNARVNLATCYEHGLGTKADHNEAFRHFEKASQSPHPHLFACFKMADFYFEDNKLVKQNYITSVSCFEKGFGCKIPNDLSQNEMEYYQSSAKCLAEMFEHGKVDKHGNQVPKNLDKALKYYRLAKVGVKDLSDEMTTFLLDRYDEYRLKSTELMLYQHVPITTSGGHFLLHQGISQYST